jgi:2-polyprenyl-3-methyl-5-hydroxy-6-metoxy-1,4-benzoquinol methylase
LAFRLLAGGSPLPELLLRRGERGGPIRQGCLQPLSLLERRTTLLDLGAGGGDLCLPCRRKGAVTSQMFVCANDSD